MGRAMAVNDGVAEVRENYGKVLAEVGARGARGGILRGRRRRTRARWR
jgi:hypothetical protein